MQTAIQKIYGADVQITEKAPVSGGDINEAYHLVLSNGTEVFLKRNAHAKVDFFLAEKAGLEALHKAGANTPEVLACGISEGTCAYLLLGYIRRARPRSNYWSLLGQMLAKMHRSPVEKVTGDSRYGFTTNNYIGQTKQINTRNSNWVEFFRTSRLAVQFDLATHYLDKEDRRRAQSILDHLDEYLNEPAFPSLVHGDLWSGNVMPDSQGAPMLIDPAVYIGHHEVDLAMTELFGGFAPDFYDAYHEIIPKEPGYTDRREIYNLYHLLNHLNLFGSSYLASVRKILKKYGK